MVSESIDGRSADVDQVREWSWLVCWWSYQSRAYWPKCDSRLLGVGQAPLEQPRQHSLGSRAQLWAGIRREERWADWERGAQRTQHQVRACGTAMSTGDQIGDRDGSVADCGDVTVGRGCHRPVGPWFHRVRREPDRAVPVHRRRGVDGLPRGAARRARVCVEFTWAGSDDSDPASGRGWAAHVDSRTLEGRISFHLGDDTTRPTEHSPVGRPAPRLGRQGAVVSQTIPS